MININIVFDHRNRTAKGKEGPLEMRFIVERKPYYISTGVRVRASEFRYGKVVGRADAAALNKRLNALVDAAHEEVTRRIEEKLPIDVACIRRKLYGQDEENTNVGMLEWMNEEIGTLRVKEGTKMHYKVLYDRLCQFGMMSEWKDLTAANICKFDSWLHSLKKDQRDADKKAGLTAELLSDGAVYNYHKCLKALLNRAVLFDLIERNPYDKLKGQFSRGEVENLEYLTDDEVKAFMSIHPLAGSDMAVSRDLFIIQLYTGMSFSDALAFNIKDYQLVDGKWMNVGRRVKTGVTYVNQLLPPVVEVLEKYKMQVPKIDNSTYNKCLKMLGVAAGIEKKMHSHLARHTFATMMLREGVRIEHVSKMLGHTNIVTTQRYAKVLADDIRKDFSMIEKKLTTKTKKQ
jgi:integrase